MNVRITDRSAPVWRARRARKSPERRSKLLLFAKGITWAEANALRQHLNAVINGDTRSATEVREAVEGRAARASVGRPERSFSSLTAPDWAGSSCRPGRLLLSSEARGFSQIPFVIRQCCP